MLDTVISACHLRHLETWKISAANVVRFIDSKHYILIVRGDQISAFREATPPEYEIIEEDKIICSSYLQEIARCLSEAGLPAHRASWLYQQFLKIEACRQCDQRLLIWDADTIPVKKINFVDNDGTLKPFLGMEHHDPYFVMLSRLLGMNKQIEKSFIAQSLPLYGSLVIEMIREVETKFHMDYKDAILSQMTSDMGISPFSEYETMGSYMYSRSPALFNLHHSYAHHWLRNGTEIMGSPQNLDLFINKEECKQPFFVSFEAWQEPFKQLKKHTLYDFLSLLFGLNPDLSVIQVSVGCNLNDDLLKEFLLDHHGQVIIAVSFPGEREMLQKLYSAKPNIHVSNAAVSWVPGSGRHSFRTLDDLLSVYEIAQPDLLILDSMRIADEILRSLPSLSMLPRCIVINDPSLVNSSLNSSVHHDHSPQAHESLARLNYHAVLADGDRVWIKT